jgi:hypothetical protein
MWLGSWYLIGTVAGLWEETRYLLRLTGRIISQRQYVFSQKQEIFLEDNTNTVPNIAISPMKTSCIVE